MGVHNNLKSPAKTAARLKPSSRMPPLLPPLRPDQLHILSHPAQTKVVAMGRRWGKTYMAGVYALTAADLGGAVAWVVPTYKNARAPWRFAEQLTAQVSRKLRTNRTERTIEFPGGGRLAVYSADNDTALRGEAFDLVIVDEAAMVREETYTDVLLPTLADRDGRMLLISTPKGRNWFWREWVRGQSAGPVAAFRRIGPLAGLGSHLSAGVACGVCRRRRRGVSRRARPCDRRSADSRAGGPPVRNGRGLGPHERCHRVRGD
jgi:hypothetical protein